MKPPKSILDRTFQYTPSAQTDLKKTFARVRREAKQQPTKVVHLKGAKRG